LRYPGLIDEAIARWVAGQGSARAGAAAITARYASGGTSQGIDLAAYLTVRTPATFAVNMAVLRDIRRLMPAFMPRSLLDAGAGPGTASWAALSVWDSIVPVLQAEKSTDFRKVAQLLNQASALPPLGQAKVVEADLGAAIAETADLVLASYVLGELPETNLVPAVRRLWAAASQILVLIEPGTPKGFARIKTARAALVAAGAHIAAPCPHDLACPMEGGDWCHFKERLSRSRAHMHAKGASVPYEDEPYAFIAVSREPVMREKLRVVSPVTVSKAAVEMTVCEAGRLRHVAVAARDKASYKAAKKLKWGDSADDL
jgi:ribosomal protein RSM22 (predicted rRNA methylase)